MEISNPGPGTILKVVETSVFNGVASAQAWLDLDLSAIIGSKANLVLLRFESTGTDNVYVRKNGDTADYMVAVNNTGGVAAAVVSVGKAVVLAVFTDALGVLEYFSEYSFTQTRGMIITLLGYIG